jgi:hypothetical protein
MSTAVYLRRSGTRVDGYRYGVNAYGLQPKLQLTLHKLTAPIMMGLLVTRVLPDDLVLPVGQRSGLGLLGLTFMPEPPSCKVLSRSVGWLPADRKRETRWMPTRTHSSRF